MAGQVESGLSEAITFESPDIVLKDLGLFGHEDILIKKMERPDHNAVITGALLWDNDAKQQYFITSADLAALQAPGQESPSG
jgi:hypothetical protein